MLIEEQVKELIHQDALSNSSRVLLCLAIDNAKPKQVKEIVEIAVRVGVRAAKKWNISNLLRSQSSRAIRVTSGWELTPDGRKFIAELAGPLAKSAVPKLAGTLRSHLPKINNPDVRAFVEEAVSCLELRLYRSSVVLSWVGAIAYLQDHVVTKHLVAFNAESTRRDAKWRAAKTADDIGKMKEFEFLQVLESISVIGKNVKQELEKQLKLRNACGHPNTLKIGENIVAAHLEVLILNVFSIY